MIPLTIELHNFLSYGSQTQVVDFKDYHLICLSGKNGHGKSALLDAMTWCLWGQARKVVGTSRPDEGLLHVGQDRMIVSFEFILNEQRYRVRREFYVQRGKSTLVLDIELFDASAGRFIALTDKTIRATQEKIDALLGIDYQTFINSAFLRQGQANEFSQKNPKERKNILANILNLTRFDSLKSEALQQSKQLLDEKKILVGVREQMLGDLALEPQLARDLLEVQGKVDSCKSDLSKSQRELEGLVEQKLKQVQYIEMLKQRQVEEKRLAGREEELLVQFRNMSKQWRSMHAERVGMVQQQQRLMQEHERLQTQDEQLLKLQAERMKLQGVMLSAQQVYQVAYHAQKEVVAKKQHEQLGQLAMLELAHKEKEQKKSTLLAQYGDLQTNLNAARARQVVCEEMLKHMPRVQAQHETLQAQLTKRKSYYQNYIQQGNWVSARLRELRQKKQLAHDVENPACPLCEQVLTVKRKNFLLVKFQDQEALLEHRLKRLSGLVDQLKVLVVAQHEALACLTQELAILQTHAQESEFLTKQLRENEQKLPELMALIKQSEQEAAAACHLYNAHQQECVRFASMLDSLIMQDSSVHAAKMALDSAKQIFESLVYDENTHKTVRNQLAVLAAQRERFFSLQSEIPVQQERLKQLHDICLQIRTMRYERKHFEGVVTKLDDAQQEMLKIDVQGRRVKDNVASLSKQHEELLAQKVRIESELARIVQLKTTEEVRASKILALEERISDYQDLCTMFGKDGVQALLIEEAIPEIEDEANKILSRLSDNKAQIFIESLRDLKKGGVKETLDIRISDAVGIRPYEMYSGGEAFRIDFALRIAISKLLARRAGSSLQTLIIDEGFGSQDEEGLSRLMEAMYVIQEDFARIIIVSHLPIFKDNFPIHIMVEKLATGSQISVVERG